MTITLTAGTVRQATQLALALVDDALRHLPNPHDPDLATQVLSNHNLSSTGEDLAVALEVLPTLEYDARLGMAGLQEVLSVGETAAELGISEQAVRQRLDNGTLAGRKAGRAWHIPREAVEAAKTRQQTGTRIRRRPAGGRTSPASRTGAYRSDTRQTVAPRCHNQTSTAGEPPKP